ncbi:MAG: DUF3667 domain-containing protein [Chloroflexales bacterium]|nr:DUF3667 domain-containing protein [Chloroflexales bacterium]
MATLDTPIAPQGAPTWQCANCGAVQASAYCAECGQKRVTTDDRRVRRLLQNAFEEITDLDSGVVATLRALLFKPGRLTADYLAGRRARYMNPVKLYLILSALFFLFAWDYYLRLGGIQQVAQGEDFQRIADWKGVPADEFVAAFAAKYGEIYGSMRFASVLVVGAFLTLLYYGKRWFYADHMVFGLHYYSFETLVDSAAALVLLGVGWALGRDVPVWATYVSQLPLFVYLYIALRRVYQLPRGLTFAKAAAFYGAKYMLLLALLPLATLLAFLFV